MNKFYKKDLAIIVDIDGTLTKDDLLIPGGADPRKDRDKFHKQMHYYDPDKLNYKVIQPVIKIVKIMHDKGVIPFFVTAREDCADGKIRENTYELLRRITLFEFPIKREQLLMREENDLRPNYQVKEDIYNTYIKNSYNVLFCLDDEDGNCEMFRKNGLVVLQVRDIIK